MKFKAPIEVESSLVDSSNSSGSAGQVLTSTGVGVDWINPTLLPAESAEKVIQTVRFGEAVSKGDPLVITGYQGSNGPAIVERADATDATKMPAYGVALEDYANNATGLMIAVGDFQDFDTSSYSVGDTLYVAVGGGMTNVKPTGTALIQNMGIVSRSNANNGDVEIVAIGRTNDVPNLPEGRLFVGTSDNTSLTSDVVYIDDANDRVGIGTTSPSDELTIEAETPTIKLKDISSSNYAEFYVNNFDTYLNSVGRTFIQNGGSTKVTVTSSGNVGIGTTAPSTPLHINADAPSLRLQDATSGDNHYLIGNNGELRVATSGYMTMRPGNTVSTTFLANGNVGIGTTSPTEKLEVAGNIKIQSALLSNQENTDVDSAAAEVVAQVSITDYTAAFFDFVIKKTTNVRSGTVYACHDGTNVEFTETSTNDLGDTSDVTLSVDKTSTNLRLIATVTSNDWSVKSLIRAI